VRESILGIGVESFAKHRFRGFEVTFLLVSLIQPLSLSNLIAFYYFTLITANDCRNQDYVIVLDSGNDRTC
jgi:hypothetical protein